MSAADPDALVLARTDPQPGEEILIHRPGAPDIRMRFERLDQVMPAAEPGWLWLHGEILEGLDNDGFWRWKTLYAEAIAPGVYRMVGVRG